MSHPRMNIYGFPHKGLRNALGQWQFQASKLDITHESEVRSFQALSEAVCLLLNLHQQAEDEVVLPEIEARVPAATEHNSREHDRLHKILEDIQVSAQTLSAGGSPAQTTSLAASIDLFIAHYLLHMAEEETEMNDVIWANFSDDELMGWQEAIMAKLSPEQKMLWFKYIIPALNPFERQLMLGNVRANAPAESYDAILTMLETVMPAHEIEPLKQTTH